MNHTRTYAGVFVVAASTLVLEILATRITSVIAWYHLSFFVISLAMLGMTAGAVIVFVLPGRFDDAVIERRLAQLGLAYACAVPPAALLALSIELQPIVDARSFMAMLAYGGTLAVPFSLAGVVLTLALTRAGLPAGRVYGIDLLGAASGCALVVPLLRFVDAPSAMLLAAAGAALSAALFAQGSARSLRWPAYGTAAFLLVLGVLNARMADPWIGPTWVKGKREVTESYAFEGWNSYSRVTVGDTVLFPPILWAPSRVLPPELARFIPQRGIEIDGAAGTAMAALDTTPDDGVPGSAAEHGYLEYDVTSFAHRLRPDGPAAVIGVGGGRDVLEAVRVGHDPVVGIELNGLIVELHRGPMREFSGIADLPGVELVEDEARSFLSRDPRRYRVITMSLIDTWAATGAGAYALSENGLYTVEGWRVFLSRLERGGIFTVSRWYKPDSPGETGRMLALAYETLWRMGVKNPRRHVMLLQNQSIATLLVSRDPFTDRDVDQLQQHAVRLAINMVLTPRRLPVNPVLREIAEKTDRAELWRWAREQELDYTPPTDERPFFFNMLRPATWLRQEEVDQLDHLFLGNLHATQTLAYATLVAVTLTLFALVGPLWSRRRDLRAYARADVLASCCYFAAIGLGFMFVEMGLLSRLNVLLGHPTLALAVLLGGIICFTGIGSLLSGRLDPTRPRVARLYPLIPAALVLAAQAALGPVLGAMPGASTPARVAIGVLVVGVPALGMGLGFPLGLRLVAAIRERAHARGETRPDLGPWLWGLNGAFGVVAGGLGLMSSMAWGTATTLWLGAACYLVLIPCTFRLQRSASRDQA